MGLTLLHFIVCFLKQTRDLINVHIQCKRNTTGENICKGQDKGRCYCWWSVALFHYNIKHYVCVGGPVCSVTH